MKPLKLIIGTLFLPTAISLAIVDTNENGLSDLWEKAHNNGDLFPQNYDPQADPDQDGWTNAQEAAAGTDPADPNPPAGIIAPDLLHTPAVMGTDGNGQPIIVTPEVLTVSWPTLIGKQYTLLFSPDLTAGSWLQVPQSTFIGDGNIHDFNFDLTSGDRCFWRVSVTDCDTDQDGLTDAEEESLGTNSNLADTDSDGLPDKWELENGLAADDSTGINGADGDPDGDGINNQGERSAGTKANNASDFPVHMIRARKIAYGYSTQTGEDAGYDGGYFWDATNSGFAAETLSPVNVNYLDLILEGFPFPADPSSPGSWSLERNPASVQGVSDESVSWLFGGLSSPPENGDWSCDGTVRASRVWLKVPVADHLRKFPYLRFTEQTVTPVVTEDEDPEEGELEIESADMVDFEVAANQTVSGHKDLAPLPPIQANSQVKHVEHLSRFGISDNNTATGVDNISITAASTSGGYQDKYWIMAPCGNDTQNNPCENAMAFDVLSMPKSLLTTTCANAQMVLATAADGGTHKWHGTSAETTEATPSFTLDGHSLTFPVGVKAMKRRTVKVVVHYVTGVNKDSSGNTISGSERSPKTKPTEAAIKQKLYDVFSRQVNTWFDNLTCVEEQAEWDIGESGDWGSPEHPVNSDLIEKSDRVLEMGGNIDTPPVGGSSKLISVEEARLQALRTTGNDAPNIDVFVVGGCWQIESYLGLSGALGRFDEGQTSGVTKRDRRSVYVAGDHRNSDKQLEEDELLEAIAHEIGHVFVGAGHPDQDGGVAPLVGTDRALRLMFSDLKGKKTAGKLNENLLVKKEWDEAEIWLNTNINSLNQ